MTIRLHSLCITWGGGGGGGEGEHFWGIQNFQNEIGGTGNFQLTFREDFKFSHDPYQLYIINLFIICLKFLIQRMQIDNETTVHYGNNLKSTIT